MHYYYRLNFISKTITGRNTFLKRFIKLKQPVIHFNT